MSKTEKLTSVASLIGVHHLGTRAGLVDPVSVWGDWVGYHVYLQHGTSVCWYIKPGLSLDQLQQIW